MNFFKRSEVPGFPLLKNSRMNIASLWQQKHTLDMLASRIVTAARGQVRVTDISVVCALCSMCWSVFFGGERGHVMGEVTSHMSNHAPHIQRSLRLVACERT
jgi:hypothetical protein